jgi:hypothetical protein
MNDNGDVYAQFESIFGKYTIKWGNGEEGFVQIDNNTPLPQEASGIIPLEENDSLILKKRITRSTGNGFIIDVYSQDEYNQNRNLILGNYFTNNDITLLGILPQSNKFVVGTTSGDISICEIQLKL